MSIFVCFFDYFTNVIKILLIDDFVNIYNEACSEQVNCPHL
jgi:hypothetical protein